MKSTPASFLARTLVLASSSLLIVLAALALVPSAVSQAPATRPLYLDPAQPIEVRVEDLLSRMTLKEKVGQLNMPVLYSDHLGKDIPARLQNAKLFVAGTYTSEIGPGGGFFSLADNILHTQTAAQQADYFNLLQRIALTQTRLKIPLLQTEEGTHGGMFPNATVFPEGLALGSTWDMPLIRAVYTAAAQEARSIGIHELSTLVVEVLRDPRLGRNEEAYTEDPYLYSRIAENVVRGAQGNNVADNGRVVALLTDFPAQSEPLSGLERGALQISDRKLREVFLPPWIAAIKGAGALGVMAAYPEFDDIPGHASEKILTDILRHELGFRGIVLSEGDGFETLIYEDIVPTQKEAGAIALRAGVDVDITYEPAYMAPLIENVNEGRVPVALVDRAVRRVLAQKFRLGLFEHPYVVPTRAQQVMHSPEHQQLALAAAREGIVLLKNDRNALPLPKALRTIAVIGPDANAGKNQLGDYSPAVIPQHITSVLDGIRQKLPGANVRYARGCAITGDDRSGFAEAVRAAQGADAAIVVVGEGEGDNQEKPTDGEGYDVASLDLTGVQEDLVKAVVATGTPTVVVLINGRPLSVRWIAEHVPAIVEAWHPGERGGAAVADVLFGDYNPSGRLAITVPRHSGQLPVFYNHPPSKLYWIQHGWGRPSYVDIPATPLYNFGDGLSYTTYEYRNLRITPAQIHPEGTIQVSVDVTNTGQRAGIETAQLYFHERYASVSTPVEQLRGFQRLDLRPGETKTATFTLGPDDLQLLNQDMHWVVEPGQFDVMVGHSSQDIRTRGTFEVMP